MKNERTITVLLLLLATACASTPDPVREGVRVPLAPAAQPVEQLLRNLRSSVPGTRASAAWQFAAVDAPDPEVRKALRDALGDQDERVREAAAWALGHVGAGDEPPYDQPPRAVRITRPRYPTAAFNAKIEGTVWVDILIGASGKVVHAEVRRSIPALDAAAVELVKAWTFEPAQLNGKPVPAFADAPVTFRID